MGVCSGLTVATGKLGELLSAATPVDDRVNALEAEKVAVEAERDQARREIEALRAGASKGAEGLGALKKERDEMDALRREQMGRVEALESEKVSSEQQIKTLQAGLDAARNEVNLLEADSRRVADQGARASAELFELRKQVETLAIEREGAVAQAEEAQSRVTTLEEEQASLRDDLESSKRNRRATMTKMSRSLSDISAKLDTAKTSYMPWQEIAIVKSEVGNAQKEADQAVDLVRSG